MLILGNDLVKAKVVPNKVLALLAETSARDAIGLIWLLSESLFPDISSS